MVGFVKSLVDKLNRLDGPTRANDTVDDITFRDAVVKVRKKQGRLPSGASSAGIG